MDDRAGRAVGLTVHRVSGVVGRTENGEGKRVKHVCNGYLYLSISLLRYIFFNW